MWVYHLFTVVLYNVEGGGLNHLYLSAVLLIGLEVQCGLLLPIIENRGLNMETVMCISFAQNDIEKTSIKHILPRRAPSIHSTTDENENSIMLCSQQRKNLLPLPTSLPLTEAVRKLIIYLQ